jgi:hypothetical protein
MVFLKVGIPVSTSSPTNIFDIPDMTIVIGTDIGQPATLCSNCQKHTTIQETTEEK